MIAPAPLNPRTIRVVHRVLLAGVVLIGAVFLVIMQVLGGALNAGLALAGYAFAAVALALLLVAGFLVRPRLPERTAAQSEEEYWQDGRVRSAAVLVWVLCEGAAIVGWVGFLLAGVTVAAAVGVLALGALLWHSPGRLARA